jgi:transcriptional regulator with XRE-family HTH domain
MDEEEQLRFVISKIREIRIQKRISQLELSAISNLSQSFLASLEKGKKQPSVLTLLRIAKALNVTPKNFFPDTEVKSNDEKKEQIIDLVRSL